MKDNCIWKALEKQSVQEKFTTTAKIKLDVLGHEFKIKKGVRFTIHQIVHSNFGVHSQENELGRLWN